MPEKNGKAYVVDTNVLVHDPNSIEVLRENGSTLIVPWVVALELDKLKQRPDIGFDAREAIRKIEELRKQGDNSLQIRRNPSFRNLSDLDKKVPDHQVIATAKTVQQKKEFKEVCLMSCDRTVRILAREVGGLRVEEYFRDQAVVPKRVLKEINVPKGDISKDLYFPYENGFDESEIEENEGVVCYSDYVFNPRLYCNWKKAFVAIKKEERFRIISPNINALGLRPYSLNGDGENWHQRIALGQLLDPTIELVFLQGGAGSGKTLLAIASAIEQRKLYRQIIITRPMIHLEDEDRMGFLPGDEQQKMFPWLRPIMQALDFLKSLEGCDNEHLITKLIDNKKMDFESLDYIRGMTYLRTFMIVDEAQNLTPHQIKTIITRAGMGTKVVFTGDLSQIDRRRRLDERSSGLAYAISRMSNHPSVGVTLFKETVRSPLSSLAEERM